MASPKTKGVQKAFWLQPWALHADQSIASQIQLSQTSQISPKVLIQGNFEIPCLKKGIYLEHISLEPTSACRARLELMCAGIWTGCLLMEMWANIWPLIYWSILIQEERPLGRCWVSDEKTFFTLVLKSQNCSSQPSLDHYWLSSPIFPCSVGWLFVAPLW